VSLEAATPKRTSSGTVIFILAAIGIVILLAVIFSGQFEVTVTTWSAGSSNVRGSIENKTQSGCTEPEITLHMRDHNGAIVQEFTFGAGDLAKGQKRDWTTHVVGFLGIDAPVPSNVTSITADATCADKH
jgi:hypothetical protein